jgi:putative hydrolase of the HAD superfamily
MSDSQFRAVTLDAGNTLLYCDPPPAVIYAQHISRLGPPVTPEEVEPVFRETWVLMQQATPSGRDRYSSYPGGERAWWGAFVREVLHRLEHPAPWRALLDDLYAAFSHTEVWRLYPDTLDTLQQLAKRGFKLAVISNWDRRLPEILDRLAIARYFDATAVSSLEGVEKPAPEIFQRTLGVLDVAPELAVHAGDSPRDDYLGAEAAGLTPVLVDRGRLYADTYYRRVERLDGLMALLG